MDFYVSSWVSAEHEQQTTTQQKKKATLFFYQGQTFRVLVRCVDDGGRRPRFTSPQWNKTMVSDRKPRSLLSFASEPSPPSSRNRPPPTLFHGSPILVSGAWLLADASAYTYREACAREGGGRGGREGGYYFTHRTKYHSFSFSASSLTFRVRCHLLAIFTLKQKQQNPLSHFPHHAKADHRHSRFPPEGTPQGREPREDTQEGRQDEVQDPLLPPPVHARHRRQGEGREIDSEPPPGFEEEGYLSQHTSFCFVLSRSKD